MELRTVFWQRVANSFPAPVRARYASELEQAEAIDLWIGAAIDAWRDVRAALWRRRNSAYTGS
jgi:hypothetical protein